MDAGSYGFVIPTKTAGLRLFEPNSGKVTDLFGDDTRLHNSIIINTIELLDNNELWIGSESGIYIYNLETDL